MKYVINIRHLQSGWQSNPNLVYIGRANRGLRQSKWHNPFKIGRDGTREEVIAKYRQHVIGSGLVNDIEELRGKTLVCWCKPAACHGDVLVELLGGAE